MAEIIKPDYSNIWASGGAVISPSAAKIQVGWTAEVPPHQWENWSQNRQDTAIAYLFQRGIAGWDATTEYFGNKSVVVHNGNMYLALNNNTGSEPSLSNTDWVRVLTSNVTATTTTSGVVELATTTEAQALTDATRAITPATLAASFQGSNQTLAINGYQKLPGGLILQWGQVTSGSVSTATHVFPTPFPTNCFALTAGPLEDNCFVSLTNITRTSFGSTGFDAVGTGSNRAVVFKYIAIGI